MTLLETNNTLNSGHPTTASHSSIDNKELIKRHNAKPVVVTRTKAPLTTRKKPVKIEYYRTNTIN